VIVVGTVAAIVVVAEASGMVGADAAVVACAVVGADVAVVVCVVISVTICT
jgi:hypothetical protein